MPSAPIVVGLLDDEHGSMAEAVLSSSVEKQKLNKGLERCSTRLLHSSVESEINFMKDAHPMVTMLLHFLHHKKFHNTMIALLCLDVLCVASSIALEIEYLHEAYENAKIQLKKCKWTYYDPSDAAQIQYCSYMPYSYGPDAVHDAHIYIAYLSLTILSTFMVENIMLMICMGKRFFKSWMSLLDVFIIATSIVLEVIFISDPEDGALAVARTWRFARIYHGFYEFHRDHGQDALEQRLKRNADGIFEAYKMIGDETSMRPETHEKESVHATRVPQLTPEESRRIARRIYETNPELIVYLAGVAGSFLLDSEHNIRVGEVNRQNTRADGDSLFSVVKSRSRAGTREWEYSHSGPLKSQSGPILLNGNSRELSGYHSAVSTEEDPDTTKKAARGGSAKIDNKLDEV
jgi:hypothetical protein